MPENEISADWLEKEPIGVIDKIELLTVRLPFVAPFGTSVAVWNCKEALLVRLEDKGSHRLGRMRGRPRPLLRLGNDRLGTVHHKEFFAAGAETRSLPGRPARSWDRVRGNEMAKAALENALLDLLAKRRGLPLHVLLGFPPRRIMSGISIGIQETIDQLLEKVEEATGQRLPPRQDEDPAWAGRRMGRGGAPAFSRTWR